MCMAFELKGKPARQLVQTMCTEGCIARGIGARSTPSPVQAPSPMPDTQPFRNLARPRWLGLAGLAGPRRKFSHQYVWRSSLLQLSLGKPCVGSPPTHRRAPTAPKVVVL
eukprot:XP_001701767.1 predicted protein [Chlamydomonas reinhardtii]